LLGVFGSASRSARTPLSQSRRWVEPPTHSEASQGRVTVPLRWLLPQPGGFEGLARGT
jgi:hypothetical protein